jgi:hypothetical protein
MIVLVLKWVLGLAMMAVGVLHFVSPKGFESIVPKSLPAPRLLVFISGAAEIAGGLVGAHRAVPGGVPGEHQHGGERAAPGPSEAAEVGAVGPVASAIRPHRVGLAVHLNRS